MTLDGVANPLLYLDRVRPGISGRSAAAVIRNVAAELDSEISRAEAKAAGADKLLAAIVVDHPRYYWDSRRKVPTIEFSVYNGGKTAISRIFIGGVLTVPGRTGKWVTGGLNYRFRTGIAARRADAGNGPNANNEPAGGHAAAKPPRREHDREGHQYHGYEWEKARSARYRPLGGHAE